MNKKISQQPKKEEYKNANIARQSVLRFPGLRHTLRTPLLVQLCITFPISTYHTGFTDAVFEVGILVKVLIVQSSMSTTTPIGHLISATAPYNLRNSQLYL
jgi:hypothetical protein